tara:strand:+ start:4535 stop:5716 length:1182 start_codon:yes stop_codon:yes gene_type:complete
MIHRTFLHNTQKNINKRVIYEFNKLKKKIKNKQSPLLEVYSKNYDLNIPYKKIKKFRKYENIIIIGMGGSILGIKSIYSFLSSKIKKNVIFFDNLNEHFIDQFNNIKNKKKTCFIIISKSGNTLETIINFNLVYKDILKKNFIIITENSNSILRNFAKEKNLIYIEHREYIGGRFSVLSEVGMAPAYLMGVDIKKFRNLFTLLEGKKIQNKLIKDVSNIYHFFKKKQRINVNLVYDSDLKDLVYWYQQLISESLGKSKKGIYPTISTNPKDHHSLYQLYLDGPRDKFYTFFASNVKSGNGIKRKITKNFNLIKNIDLNKIIKSQSEASQSVFKRNKIPFRAFEFKKKNSENLGLIFKYFILEVILLSKILKVNAFNQPAVESIKAETKKILLR